MEFSVLFAEGSPLSGPAGRAAAAVFGKLRLMQALSSRPCWHQGNILVRKVVGRQVHRASGFLGWERRPHLRKWPPLPGFLPPKAAAGTECPFPARWWLRGGAAREPLRASSWVGGCHRKPPLCSLRILGFEPRGAPLCQSQVALPPRTPFAHESSGGSGTKHWPRGGRESRVRRRGPRGPASVPARRLPFPAGRVLRLMILHEPLQRLTLENQCPPRSPSPRGSPWLWPLGPRTRRPGL